jgi:hypothetical protein
LSVVLVTWATKVDERTTSSVVTPKSLKGPGRARGTSQYGVGPLPEPRRKGRGGLALLGVVGASLLEDLGGDRDGRVDRVRDDEDGGLGAVVGDALGEVADDRGVGVEEVVARHAGLAGDAGRDDDNLGTGQGTLEVLLGEALDLGPFQRRRMRRAKQRALETRWPSEGEGDGQTYDGGRVNVAEVGADTGRATDVVEPEVGHVLVELEEEREGLADASCSRGARTTMCAQGRKNASRGGR